MGVLTEKFTISSKGFDDVIDITSRVQNIVSRMEKNTGIVNISTVASTASIITLDDEFNLSNDFSILMENIVPLNRVYKHDLTWHDGNAHAHLKASILGNSITLSVIDKKAVLNSYQRIVLIDFDNKPSIRQIIVSVVY